MKIKFYKYKGPTNAINKLAQAEFVKEIDYEPTIPWDGSVFVLKISEIVKANYATFNYMLDDLNIDMAGYLEPGGYSKGMWTYILRYDELECSYRLGAFSGKHYVTHSMLGSKYLFDERIASANAPQRTLIQNQTYQRNLRVLVNILARPKVNETGRGTYNDCVQSPTLASYVMTFSQFVAFYNNVTGSNTGTEHLISTAPLNAKNQTLFLPSIVGIYVIDYNEIPDIMLHNESTVNLIYVNKLTDEQQGFIIHPIDFLSPVKQISYNLVYPQSDPVYKIQNDTKITINGTDGFELVGGKINASFNYQLPCGINFNFQPRVVLDNGTNVVNSVNYASVFNPSSASFKYYLVVNGAIKYDVHAEMAINNILQIAYDTSLNRNSDYWKTIGSAVITAGTAIAAVALAGPTGGASIAAWGAAIGVAAGSIAGGVTGAMDVAYQHETGSYSVSGNGAWSYDLAENSTSKLIIMYNPQIDRENFQAKYGKPDFHMRNLEDIVEETLHPSGGQTPKDGYVRCSGARLGSTMGLYVADAEETDDTLNSVGVFILT